MIRIRVRQTGQIIDGVRIVEYREAGVSTKMLKDKDCNVYSFEQVDVLSDKDHRELLVDVAKELFLYRMRHKDNDVITGNIAKRAFDDAAVFVEQYRITIGKLNTKS